MGRNHLETSRKGGVTKGASPAHTRSRPTLWRDSMAWGASPHPHRNKTWTPDWAPQHGALEPESVAYIVLSGVRQGGFCSMGETESAGDKATGFLGFFGWLVCVFVLKGPKHKFFIFSHSPCALVKGRRASWTGVA